MQEFYFAKLGEVIQDQQSSPAPRALEMVDPAQYYEAIGSREQGMRVPTDLDESICRYMTLPKSKREKFDRAAFWMDAALQQHNLSVSASFAFLAMAIEALVGRVVKPTEAFCEVLFPIRAVENLERFF